MFAEIALSYYLASNMSSHLSVIREPKIDSEIRLNVSHEINNRWDLKVSPYVLGADRIARIAGAEFELNYRFNDTLMLGYYHHSSHTLDMDGEALNMDGIRFRWILKK